MIPEYRTCEICGEESPAGIGVWACVDGEHYVHQGRCWRAYEAQREGERIRSKAFIPAELGIP